MHRAAIAGLNDPTSTGEDKRSKGKGKGQGKGRGKKEAGAVIAGRGTAATNKQVAQRQDKKEIRDGFHAQIRSIMDLEAQERVLNAQGRRTLRDPLDEEQISPMCTLIRGCMELYEVRCDRRRICELGGTAVVFAYLHIYLRLLFIRPNLTFVYVILPSFFRNRFRRRPAMKPSRGRVSSSNRVRSKAVLPATSVSAASFAHPT